MMKTHKSFYKWLLLTGVIACLLGTKATGQTDFTTISDRIFDNFQAASASTTDTQAAALLSTLQADYSWPDINYTSTSQTDWAPGNHLARMGTLAKAYSKPTSTYYGDANLKTKIEGIMNYWLTLSPAPNSTNWFYLSISVPKDIGNTLICLRKAPLGISQTLENQMIAWMTKGVSIAVSPAKDGSNLTDVAQHYIMRACLTQDQALLNQAITAVTSSIVVTTGEGIQNDNSYTAHGPQLYVYGYGREYISGISNIAVYVAGTSYAFSSDKLAVFSNFVRKGFIKPSRGAYADYNLYGRGVSRANAGKADVALIEKVKGFDLPAYASEYDNAIQRMRGLQPASYNVNAEHLHYWRTDYTVHHRPGYMFGLRSISSRNAKSEMGNGENIKGYYLTEGANYIAVDGDEYYNIFPVWEWNKIPGTTVPEITTYPVRSSWGVNFGTVPFVGGVSDGVYGVSAYAMNDYGTTAKKSWFFFDDEVVCLGAGITSSASQAINTTVNQSLLKTDVTVSDISNNVSVLSNGSRDYAGNLKWVLQGNVGYFFPAAGLVSLSNQAQSGSWNSINTTGSAATVSADVFKLWFKHGIAPGNASYAYIVAPGKTSAAEMQAYNASNISILSNTATIQAVRHNALGVWQVVFYQPGEFTAGQVTVKANKACTIILKNAESNDVTVHIADPAQNSQQIYVGIKNAQLPVMKAAAFTMPTGANAGSSISAHITGSNPDYLEPVDPLMVLTSTADAFVRSGGSGSTAAYANTNYGTDAVLTVKKESAGYDREAFIKFDLSTVNLNPDSAVIQLRVNNANTSISSTKWAFYLVENNAWTETGITWSNKPAHTTKLGERTGIVTGSTVRLNVTPAVISRLAADKVFSLHIVSEPTTTDVATISKTDASFNARENANALFRPQIWIYGTPSSGPETLKDSLTATADSYVRSGGNAANNYGSQGYLVARNKSDDTQETYLAFDLHGMHKNISNAKIRLWALENGISTGWNLSIASNSYSTSATAWTETSINWNNKPQAGSSIAATTSPAAAGYIYFDITSALAAISSDSILTVKVTASTDLYSSFRSRNFATDALRPKLVYDYTTNEGSLPVELVYFKGNAEQDVVNLFWETASERDNDYFEIERSADARHFDTIGRISGSGTAKGARKYKLTDPEAALFKTGNLYYRLKQVDFDGTSSLSSIISVSLGAKEKLLTIGPNPTSDYLNVFLDNNSNAATLSIIGRDGLTLAEKQVMNASKTTFDLSRYQPGLYFVKIRQNGQAGQVYKFVIQK
ncbi:DNRLRE domain-containing protein [Dyadobacter sp. CY261]|uniref:polysaccharide lyase family 8 super-sandwich domain-containing protein n=1 Tax=Dyadobacter sp. CY261 TaxID=2907203 RepID=UPI001F220401|nr:polysaccharide lyase family 8 super-sandwich domain-containing protein [Dyadobacter sp. CY261]MCF0072980.1 DNRLRE domain-containing protein [Dyadobacter sp. CY261]